MAAPTASLQIPSSELLVGYGKWSELTYQQVWDQEAEYCLWTINKFQELVKEGDELPLPYVAGDSKMKCLAHWITEVDQKLQGVEPQFECDSDMEVVEVEKPENQQTLAERCAKLRAAAAAAKFYGVASPEEHAGIYTSWDECKPHVVGVKGVRFKSFPSEEEAAEYVKNPPPPAVRPSETPEAKAAREAAKVAKEEAKAVKAAEAKAAREQAKAAKDEAKAAKMAQAKATKEEAKAAKEAAKEEAKAAKLTEAIGFHKGKVTSLDVKQVAGKKRKSTVAPKPADTNDAQELKRSRNSSTTKGDSEMKDAQAMDVQAVAVAAEQPSKKLQKPSKATLLKKVAAKVKAKAKAKAATAKAKGKAKAKAKVTSPATTTGIISDADVVKRAKELGMTLPSNKTKAVNPTKGKREKESKTSTDTQAAKGCTKSSKAAATASTIDAKSISQDVLKRASELGMTKGLHNLASRADIISKGLSSEQLLDALIAADGLVNKAKNTILSPGPVAEPISPTPLDRWSPPISPEKHEEDKQEKADEDALAKTLSNLSATLRLVATPQPRKEEVHANAGVQPNLTESQMQRIKENRERALARKTQAGN